MQSREESLVVSNPSISSVLQERIESWATESFAQQTSVSGVLNPTRDVCGVLLHEATMGVRGLVASGTLSTKGWLEAAQPVADKIAFLKLMFERGIHSEAALMCAIANREFPRRTVKELIQQGQIREIHTVAAAVSAFPKLRGIAIAAVQEMGFDERERAGWRRELDVPDQLKQLLAKTPSGNVQTAFA